MFSIFEKLISFSVKVKNIIFFKKINSPTIKTKFDFGKNNIFIKKGLEIKPRSKGPYLIIKNQKLEEHNEQFLRYNFDLSNLGSEPANNTRTHTEIYINNELKFKSPISASSIIPPDFSLDVLSEDSRNLVANCTKLNPLNKLIFVAEYEDLDRNKFMYLKAFWYESKNNELSTREEKAIRLIEDKNT